MNTRELTDAECDAIAEAVTEAGLPEGSCWGDAAWDRALIRAGAAAMAAGVARDVCPMCKGRGKVMRPSFSDSSKDIERSCHVCKGSGLIDAAPRELVAGVAREPTPEMLDAGESAHHFDSREELRLRFIAMYDAAPRNPAPEPVAWRDPTNTNPGQGCTYEKSVADKWPHIYRQPLYTREGGGT